MPPPLALRASRRRWHCARAAAAGPARVAPPRAARALAAKQKAGEATEAAKPKTAEATEAAKHKTAEALEAAKHKAGEYAKESAVAGKDKTGSVVIQWASEKLPPWVIFFFFFLIFLE